MLCRLIEAIGGILPVLVVRFLRESVRAEYWDLSTKELHCGKENEEGEKESEENQEEVILSFGVNGRRNCGCGV
jgi:hypothetical protein